MNDIVGNDSVVSYILLAPLLIDELVFGRRSEP
jgi:hypothetical protein